MDYIAQAKDYWIAPGAITITLNALGSPQRIQGSVSSGAVIMCYISGVEGLGYDNGHQYRAWSISISPTYFNSFTKKYVYMAIPRNTEVGAQAIIVFPSEKLDIYGVNESDEQIGSEDYYYIWLQALISDSAAGGIGERSFLTELNFGLLSTDEARDDQSYNTDWYTFNAVTQTVTFLKEIIMKAGSSFRNLILGGKELTGVATGATPEEYVDSETLVVTPSYLNANYNHRYIRKDQDDSTPFNLGVGQNLNVDGDVVVGGVTRTNNVISSNYTGDGITDTGYRLTMDDGTGSSALTVDNLHVRKKATFEELEVKKETAIAGNQIFSAAANVILRTDYYDIDGNLLGYSNIKVPWLLRGMAMVLGKNNGMIRGLFAHHKTVRITMTPEQAQSIHTIRCYFLAKDDEREIKNLWRGGGADGHDLARCQTMNLKNSKRNTYISDIYSSKLGNVYWWRKVIGVSTNPVVIEDKEYHYIDLSWSDCAAGSDIPAAGDHVVQFGNDSNTDRMNLLLLEINGADAPSIKALRGIFTYNLNLCYWGGQPQKMKLSPATGYEFFGPHFKYVQEYGVKPASIDRGAWLDIPLETDEMAGSGTCRKCYYYDKVTHNGSYWLCVYTPSGSGTHYVANTEFTYDSTTYHVGDLVPNSVWVQLSTTQKTMCDVKQDYTSQEPSDNATAWQKQVAQGPKGSGYQILLKRDGLYTDANWNTYAALGHSESFSKRTPQDDDISFTDCRIGDLFVVSGTSSDSGIKHTATYKCTAVSASSITGECISHIADGEQGENGKDGWMVTADPANVIITQSLGTDTTQFSTQAVTFSAKKGSVNAAVTGVLINAQSDAKTGWTHFTGSVSGTTVTVTAPTLDSSQNYYTEGYFVAKVSVTDPDSNSTITFYIKVPCYANLLGTWKESVEAGEENIAASKIIYTLGASGSDIETIKSDYTSKRNATISLQEWKTNKESTYNGYDTRINSVKDTADEHTQELTAIKAGKNLLKGALSGSNFRCESSVPYPAHQVVYPSVDDDGWMNTVDNNTCICTSATITRGKDYVLSFYTKAYAAFDVTIWKSAAEISGWTLYKTLSFAAVSQASAATTRRSATFKLTGSTNQAILICFAVKTLRYPQLELGTEATAFEVDSATETSSRISQSAEHISLKVKETGIDIDEKTITLNAEKTVINGDLTVPRVVNMYIDENGKGMTTTIEAGKVLIESVSTPSYGLFQVNTAGEIVLKMVDKDGHVVVNLGGSTTMQAGSWSDVRLKRVDVNGVVTDSAANFTAFESDLTTYHKLTLGRVNNGGIVTYYLPNGNETHDLDVISLDGYLFTSTANTEAGIKALTKIAGYYVKRNDGIFFQEPTPTGEGGDYFVNVYRYIAGKQQLIEQHSFSS